MKAKPNNLVVSRRLGFAEYLILRTKARASSGFSGRPARNLLALLIVTLLGFSDLVVRAESGREPQPVSPTEQEAPRIPNDQLDSLVAPIALYPDPLLTQTLVAATYPLEIIQLQQWLSKNSNLKDKALTEAVSKQTWDPSIQAMAVLPEAAAVVVAVVVVGGSGKEILRWSK